ncbi:MAG: hypothetical protein O7B99_12695 [Planctomycetota bacterium]|nr:hypothetical protein [Planctomycetota bacterium]
MKLISSALASLLVAAPAVAQVRLWVVDDDPGPSVDFTDIQPAVDAAADGDTILVRDGVYSGFVFFSKGLSVVGELGASVVIQDGQIGIHNLAPDQTVLLQNLEVQGWLPPGSPTAAPALALTNDEGPVRVEDSRFLPQTTALPGPSPTPLGGGASTFNCDSVTFERCELVAGTFALGDSLGRDGLSVTQSEVYLYDCDVTGGPGLAGPCHPMCFPSLTGGDGASVTLGFLFASGTTFTGGPGLSGCGQGGNGGNGVYSDSEVWFLDSFAAAATGGPAGSGCAPGADGSLTAGPGPFNVLPGEARHLSITSPVTGGDIITITCEGEPGDAVFLGGSLTPDTLWIPEVSGVLLIVPGFINTLGLIPPSGKLTFLVPSSPITTADVLTLHLQAVFVVPSSQAFVGPGVTLVITKAIP